jgi:hypothetical protein
MQNFREIEERVLANGKIEGHEIEALRQCLYADGKIDRNAADFLVVLHKRVRQPSPGLDKFFYQAIKDHVLADGGISAGEADWLRRMVFRDGKIDDQERKFLLQLNGEAKEVSPEFEKLFEQCMRQPMEPHTSGHG